MGLTMKISSEEDYSIKYSMAADNPELYWAKVAELFEWDKKWDRVSSGSLSDHNFKWFEGGKLNITNNCIDRHLKTKGDEIAVVWVPNNPSEPDVKISFRELHARVCRFANVLKSRGVEKGDRICFYMGMVPELLVGVLACARIGAVHSVVFGGFSANSLANRIKDSEAKVLVTCDISNRGDKIIPLLDIANDALTSSVTISSTIVVQVNKETKTLQENQAWLHDLEKLVTAECPYEVMDAEDPLFILYTSGSTGKPKGLVHTTAGYMVYAAHTFENVFQIESGDVHWCSADIGWITGHSYITYGPLLNGSTTVMFEGVPTWPDAGRFWEICERLKVTHFYTAPTAIRALECFGEAYVSKYDLSCLKVLGTVGEPINEQAWNWYYQVVGKSKCPIVDTWWQTETGGIMISAIAGITPSVPTFATKPLPGVCPVLMNDDGEEIETRDGEGKLCIKRPWPGMARTIFGDDDRYKDTYLRAYPGYYFTGDGAKRDQSGNYRITGRVDDVIIVSGHNIGTAEVEDAIGVHDNVVESAVVGYPHDIKGNAIKAYIIVKDSSREMQNFREEIIEVVAELLGPIAKPDAIQIVEGLPKTRSGKIMRRILRKIAAGELDGFGDTTTLLNPEIVDKIKDGAKNLDLNG